jgi:predicted ester cyclase
MTLKDAKSVFEETVKRINAGDRRWLDWFYSPTMVIHGAGVDFVLDDARKWWADMWNAFPDLRFRGEVILVGEDGYTARWVFAGTHTGPYLGKPPTGKRFEMSGMGAYRMHGGKCAEEWSVADFLGLREQLGLAPKLG